MVSIDEDPGSGRMDVNFSCKGSNSDFIPIQMREAIGFTIHLSIT